MQIEGDSAGILARNQPDEAETAGIL